MNISNFRAEQLAEGRRQAEGGDQPEVALSYKLIALSH